LAAVSARSLCHDSSTQTLRGNNAKSSDQTANGNVNHHGFLSVLWAEPESGYSARNDDDTCIAEKAWCDDPFLHILDFGNSRLLWGVYGDNNRANDAVKTAHFSYKTQAFLEKYGGQYSTYDDR
jgi:hypothetical protein